jgi:hypothetical protein
MANRRRGEVEAILDGRPATLVLTLGALCELESAFAADDLSALADRFAAGRLSARDMIRIVACGLRGAGRDVGEAEVSAMRIDGGVVGWAAVVADLLAVTFGGAEPSGEPSAPGAGEATPRPPAVPGGERPSPGTR